MRYSEALEMMGIMGWVFNGEETLENLTWFEAEAGIPKPTQEELECLRQKAISKKDKDSTISELKKKLDDIDFRTIRPMREGETDIVEQLKNEAMTLREQLRSIINDNEVSY